MSGGEPGRNDNTVSIDTFLEGVADHIPSDAPKPSSEVLPYVYRQPHEKKNGSKRQIAIIGVACIATIGLYVGGRGVISQGPEDTPKPDTLTMGDATAGAMNEPLPLPSLPVESIAPSTTIEPSQEPVPSQAPSTPTIPSETPSETVTPETSVKVPKSAFTTASVEDFRIRDVREVLGTATSGIIGIQHASDKKAAALANQLEGYVMYPDTSVAADEETGIARTYIDTARYSVVSEEYISVPGEADVRLGKLSQRWLVALLRDKETKSMLVVANAQFAGVEDSVVMRKSKKHGGELNKSGAKKRSTQAELLNELLQQRIETYKQQYGDDVYMVVLANTSNANQHANAKEQKKSPDCIFSDPTGLALTTKKAFATGETACENLGDVRSSKRIFFDPRVQDLKERTIFVPGTDGKESVLTTKIVFGEERGE